MILYHASSSYYSMIARLALAAAAVPYQGRRMDIHLAKEQLADWYVKINPHMTVPSLVDGSNLLIDSRDILRFAAAHAGSNWADQNPAYSQAIESIVDQHYEISIEQLTFGKALLKIAPARIIVPRMLRGIIKKLEGELKTTSDPKTLQAVQAKIDLNRHRLAYFTEGDLVEKLDSQRQEVTRFLETLPALANGLSVSSPSQMLFGEQGSSADIVTAVLLGRLKMIGEYQLVKPGSALDLWFERMQQSAAFKQADIWLRFQAWRILLKR